MSKNTEDRIQALEEEIAHLSRTNDELSGEVAKQRSEIETLQGAVNTLKKRINELLDNMEPEIKNTMPPHW